MFSGWEQVKYELQGHATKVATWYSVLFAQKANLIVNLLFL
jgi:hypothetical protein